MSLLIWNPSENSDDLNIRWGQLRAIEWSAWPLFISQSLAPICLLFYPWENVAAGVVVADLLWAFVRHRFVSIILASLGSILVMLKWFICPATAIYLFLHGEQTSAAFALLWPLLVLVFPSDFGVQLGVIEQQFMAKLGYGVDN